MSERDASLKTGATSIDGLFSVDADSHLRKLASCMFPTPALLPVELVRSAIARNARSVAVSVRPWRLAIADDGDGIAAGSWRELARAFDTELDAGERERAIASLQASAVTGIGLLAAFVPDAVSVRIETSCAAASMAMEIVNGRGRQLDSGPLPAGTRITIHRRNGPASAEKKLLHELCAATPAAISLNGRAIEKRPLLRQSLVRQRVDMGPGREPALVAIPPRGDACRIWLLDRGIPWQAYACPAYHGLVFEAALASAVLPAAAEFAILAEAAHGLYLWLANRYADFPEPIQGRIEELVFERARAAGDLRLLSGFSPFRLWRSRQRLNLEEVRRQAERHALYALPVEAEPNSRLGPHQEALLLTPLQRDFLLNHLRLPLAEPPPAANRPGRLAALCSRLARQVGLMTARLPRPLLRVIPDSALTDDERSLCRGLEAHWLALPGCNPRPGLSVAMAAGGRLVAPAILRGGPAGYALLLRRRHPLVVQATRRVAGDVANAELAFIALASGELLTAPGGWSTI
jgi:hypothetical protein